MPDMCLCVPDATELQLLKADFETLYGHPPTKVAMPLEMYQLLWRRGRPDAKDHEIPPLHTVTVCGMTIVQASDYKLI